MVDDLKLLLSGLLTPLKSEEYLGQAEIRQVFKVSGAGKIAGSFVIDGLIKRNARVRLLRDNVVIHDGILKTLKRFKEDAKEVDDSFSKPKTKSKRKRTKKTKKRKGFFF